MSFTVNVVDPVSEGDLCSVRELWAEYWDTLGLASDFQDFAEELRTLPGRYAPPEGRLLLARIDDRAAGTFAMRQLRKEACEAKRLYVRPAYRGQGVAASLLARLVEEARFCGYRSVYCDTLPSMLSAQALYLRAGFVHVSAYSDVPTPDATYLCLSL